MIVKKPPCPILFEGISLFLAGSIEMGTAEEWQNVVIDHLSDLNGTIFNPRRDDWDSSWEQNIGNFQFRQQVEWELTAQEVSHMTAFYFSPKTKSPITLLELGLFSKGIQDKVVCCPEGFWRKGNVDIVCAKYGIPQVSTLNDLCKYLYEYSDV